MENLCLVRDDPDLSPRAAMQMLRSLAWNRAAVTLRDALDEATSSSARPRRLGAAAG
ncbi:MAG TPA: hypothetical protein VKI19_12920 [Acidimicrobiales bacterium]|nr:hypothetical protein [Acidimicrobiales bacterium]